MTTIDDIKLLKFPTYTDVDGNLIPIEFDSIIPFTVRRIFYVFGVHDQNNRGKHGHYTTKQILICLSGKLKVVCDDGNTSKSWTLSSPEVGLYIPELIWDEQYYITTDTIMLCLTNTIYDRSDYIEEYNTFKIIKNRDRKF